MNRSPGITTLTAIYSGGKVGNVHTGISLPVIRCNGNAVMNGLVIGPNYDAAIKASEPVLGYGAETAPLYALAAALTEGLERTDVHAWVERNPDAWVHELAEWGKPPTGRPESDALLASADRE